MSPEQRKQLVTAIGKALAEVDRPDPSPQAFGEADKHLTFARGLVRQLRHAKPKRQRPAGPDDQAFKNYDVRCENCDAVPTVGDLGLCGPCTFGEAETADGNW